MFENTAADKTTIDIPASLEKEISVDSDLIRKLNTNIPRYTSYPTAPSWKEMSSDMMKDYLLRRNTQEPISLYIHVPFCNSMCLYCGCSVVLNRNPDKEERYVQALLQEITTIAQYIQKGTLVNQIHFGGGTPTKLTTNQLERICSALFTQFLIAPDAEISIEVDPRTVVADNGEKLYALKSIGFNRISFGVQDTNEDVQEAVKRRQTWVMTRETFLRARQLGFSGINIDLIYGLPLQTVTSFSKTVEQILSLSPDRVALFSYAKVPHLKPHQNAIPDSLLPSTEEKFEIYKAARSRFIKERYTAIGMDHFASENDPLSIRYKTKSLLRNFQGYTVYSGEDMIGLGVTSISFISNAYFQNVKDLAKYHEKVELLDIPLERGIALGSEDILRRFVINRLMCDFSLDKRDFLHRFKIDFDQHFYLERERLSSHIEDGLVTENGQFIHVTPKGEMFVRNIAACFDQYLDSMKTRPYSKAI